MDIVCMYHCVDLDGQCSAAILHMAFPEVELIPWTYGMKIPWEKFDNKVVYILDLSLPTLDDWEKLVKIAKDVVWIDHHKTAIELVKGTKFDDLKGFRSIGNDAACYLTWIYLHPGEVPPKFVKLLSLYDLWAWKKRDKDEQEKILNFQYALRAMDTEPDSPLWKRLLREDERYYIFYGKGKAIRDYEKKQNARKAKNAFVTEIRGHKVLALVGAHGSLTFDSVINDYPECKGVMTLNHRGNGWTVSLYSEGGLCCGDIARTYKGGGHSGAAGFKVSTLRVLEWLWYPKNRVIRYILKKTIWR